MTFITYSKARAGLFGPEMKYVEIRRLKRMPQDRLSCWQGAEYMRKLKFVRRRAERRQCLRRHESDRESNGMA
jgi:hypothetical protein